jgi:DNA-binding NarL/FixJ family response regulator
MRMFTIRGIRLVVCILLHYCARCASTLVFTRQTSFISIPVAHHRSARSRQQQQLRFKRRSISTFAAQLDNMSDAADDRRRRLRRRDEDPGFIKRSNRWILLVDDEEAIRQAVGQMLSERGYQVTTCEDGRTALNVALNNDRVVTTKQDNDEVPDTATAVMPSRNRSVPDVIVSDVRMTGGMDGLQLLQAIRSHEKLVQVPVVLLTAKGMPHDRVAGYNAGADAYIPKPFDPDELVTVIDNVIQRHEQLNDSNNLALTDLKRDLQDIKHLLLENGGGVGGATNSKNGWVEATNVFLAPDERQILELLCQGLMNKEIADQMFLSTRRVEQLLTLMYRKTKVKNRTELVRWAISTGNVKI